MPLAPALTRAANTADDVFDLGNLRVRITEALPYAEVRHEGRMVTLMRHRPRAHRGTAV